MEILKLFDTSDFPPRWHCGLWSSAHGWTHIVADLAVAAAYFTIPALLAFFISRRPDFPFNRLAWLFCAFIVSCGTVHLVEASIFWHPMYRVSALIKVLTAIVSWVTVVALVPVIPKALALPGLAAVNEQLSQEVEERRRMEEELRDRNDMLNQFSRMASHDLKAPLRAIENLLEWVEEDASEGLCDVSGDHVDEARRRAAHLRVSIDNLLEFARADERRYGAEDVHLEDLVDEIATILGIPQCVAVDASTVPTVRAWRAPLRQVLYNLIVNAQTHAVDGDACIRVRAEETEEGYAVEVIDCGPGVPPEMRDSIFEVGRTMGQGIADDLGGSGVGLAIVKRLVSSWGGEVACLERECGRGARFRFTVPDELPGTELKRTPAPAAEAAPDAAA